MVECLIIGVGQGPTAIQASQSVSQSGNMSVSQPCVFTRKVTHSLVAPAHQEMMCKIAAVPPHLPWPVWRDRREAFDRTTNDKQQAFTSAQSCSAHIIKGRAPPGYCISLRNAGMALLTASRWALATCIFMVVACGTSAMYSGKDAVVALTATNFEQSVIKFDGVALVRYRRAMQHASHM